MSCAAIRRELLEAPERRSAALDSHLADCSACSAFAHRLARVRAQLRARQADHLPDADFALRVSRALPGDTELLGWAAARLLPATLTLLLALTAWAWLGTPSPDVLVEVAPSDDPLGWAIDLEEQP